MNRKKALSWAVAVFTVLLCTALCASALGIYASGLRHRVETGAPAAPIFTPEAVGRQLAWALPALGLWLILAIVARAAGAARPARSEMPLERTLALLRARLGGPPPEAERERGVRGRIRIVAGVVVALCAGWALAWLLNGENFTSWDLEQVMGALLRSVLPPLLLGFGALIAAARLCESSRAREKDALLAAAREARTAARAPMTGTRETRVEGDASRNDAPFGVAAAANRATESREEEPRNPATPARAPMKGARETRAKAVARAALLVAAAALIALGVRNGGLRDVLIKAINICTECIGLG